MRYRRFWLLSPESVICEQYCWVIAHQSHPVIRAGILLETVFGEAFVAIQVLVILSSKSAVCEQY